MTGPDFGLQQLARAIELVRLHRAEPVGPDAALLAAHPELRELLEPLLEPLEPPLASAPTNATAASLASQVERSTLGDYRLVRELGRGGMGVVHEAVQLSLDRRVALKVLPDHRAASPTALVRFRREAELLARLQHDHLVPVFASGEAEGVHFFAMELVDGCSLAAVLRELQGQNPTSLHGGALAAAFAAALGDPGAGEAIRGRSHVEAVLLCLQPIADALSHAHAHGVVHRDVKPANILLRRDGTPLLSDFGLARDLEAPGLTRTGEFAGTPHYVAPEQIEARSGGVDGRADVFSLGASLYELLTLRRPFDGPTTEAVMAQVLHSDPPAPRRMGLSLPDDLLAVLDKALQKSPAERYATMAAFAADLRAVLELRPVSVRHPGIYTRLRRYSRREPLKAALAAVLALGVPSLLGLSGYLLTQRPRIAAAAERECREQVEALLEIGYLELGEGSPRIAIERFRAAEQLLPGLPETTVGEALALDRLGRREEAAALADRLAIVHEDVRQELLGLSIDVDSTQNNAAPSRPAVTRTAARTALACYVRGMRWLAFAHGSADRQAYETAAAALRETIDRAPVARALYHCQYLHVLQHLQDPAPIRAFVQVVEDLWPDSPIVRYWMGFALEDIEPERALQLQRRVIVARPDLLLPHASMARVHERHGRFPDAVACYRAMLAIAPREANALIGLARVLVHCDRADEALATAEEAIAAEPLSHMAQLGHAGALLAHARYDAALVSAQRGVAIAPGDPESHRMVANILLAMGNAEAAIGPVQRAIALAPEDGDCHLMAAHVFAALGRAADAAKSLEQVVLLQPDRALAWHDLAWQREALGDADGAESALQQALQRGNDQAGVHLVSGNWRKRHGDAAAAERHYLRAIELDPRTAPAMVSLAAMRWLQGDMTDCIRLYGQAVSVQPDLEPASEGLAQALAKEGRFGEATAERRRWAEANPDQVVAWLKLAASMLRGPGADCDGALTCIARAEALASTPRADVLFWRAEVLRTRGDAADSFRGLYEQAREMPDATAELRQRIASRLESLLR